MLFIKLYYCLYENTSLIIKQEEEEMTQMEEKKKPSKLQMYTKMFASTFTLSMFTFGGGFVIVPLMKKKFVDELHWIDEEDRSSSATGC